MGVLTLISASNSSAVLGLGRAVLGFPPPRPPRPRAAPAGVPLRAGAGAATREARDWSWEGSRAISTFMGRSVG
jgi:hypothetical protein